MMYMENYNFIFIAGLHRSGTSVFSRCLTDHSMISGFANTGFPEDEGQFLQSVYPPAKFFGGAGQFGFRSEMHLTEDSILVTEDNKKRLFYDWKKHWDLQKTFLLEKSPPNLLKTRFLQEIFPHTYFVVLIRHPIAVSLATQKWSNTDLQSLLEHWLVCHEIYEQDKKHITNLYELKYEDFVQYPDFYLKDIYDFLGIEFENTLQELKSDINEKYFDIWREQDNKEKLTSKFEKRVNNFGYSLKEL